MMNIKNRNILSSIKDHFGNKEFVPLHAPVFQGNEKDYVMETINSTFVSSVGKFVDLFEEKMKDYTSSEYAIAVVNGTSALHMCLLVAGVQKDDLVLTQSLSFVATCNAISYLQASPIFIDVDIDTMGLSPKSLLNFLETECIIKNNNSYHIKSGRRISACVPMHTFGHPCKIDEILNICNSYKITLIEDAAESIGSFYKEKHTGNYSKLAAFSFNGNKTITSGGGGCIITDDIELGKKVKHLTTQAKIPHRWNFEHDFIGYNYRMPNINAALACAQLEYIEKIIFKKRELAKWYENLFALSEFDFVKEPIGAKSNFWLNTILCKDLEHRDNTLNFFNNEGIMCRPSWTLMHKLKMFSDCYRGNLSNSEWLEERIINIPSSFLSY